MYVSPHKSRRFYSNAIEISFHNCYQDALIFFEKVREKLGGIVEESKNFPKMKVKLAGQYFLHFEILFYIRERLWRG